MKMLSNLNQRAHPAVAGAGAAARRGRIDLAALLVEVAPDARVSIEPGSGTEVYGDEADLRRMLQVLIGHGSGEGASVTVRRDGDDVQRRRRARPRQLAHAPRPSAPGSAACAIRYGGRHELEGGSEVLVFPADGASDRSESAALRKELDEARKQGEVYARELAAVFDRGEEVTAVSTVPPAPGVPSEARFVDDDEALRRGRLRAPSALGPASASSRRCAVTRSPTSSSTRSAVASRTRRRSSRRSAASVSFAPTSCTPRSISRDVAQHGGARLRSLAERDEVKVTSACVPRGPRPTCAAAPRRSRRSSASSSLTPSRPRLAARPWRSPSSRPSRAGARLVVDDAGSPLPASGRRAFLALETHAGAYGRPSGLPIFLAAELAACQGAMLELSDAPQNKKQESVDAADASSKPSDTGGGLRVTVRFAKS